MKKHSQTIFALWSLACSLFLSGCVNQVTPDGQEEVVAGEVPISIRVNIQGANTRLANGSFEQGDMMGLYATVSPTAITGERYIDNLKMTSQNGWNVALEREVFYPEGGYPLDFLAYYPYRKNALATGSSTMEVSVLNDQSTPEGLSASDFLVSGQKNVSGSEAAVSLEFRHKLARISLALKPADGSDLHDILADGILATAVGFHTTATYDFQTDRFQNPAANGGIHLSGEWQIRNDSLVGVSFIVIPQSIADQTLVLEIDGHQQTVTFNASEGLASGKDTHISVSLDNHGQDYLRGVVTSISEWEDGGTGTGTGSSRQNAIHLSTLSFATSDIYRIYRSGLPIGEICREYLRLEGGVDSRAIVHYPVQNHRADLTQGTVLCLLDAEGDCHMGEVSWDPTTNRPAYTPGTSAAPEAFYIDADGAVSLQGGEPVSLVSRRIMDRRGDVSHAYPVVKVATQYWMKSDLQATLYTDGSPIPPLSVPDGTAGYLTHNSMPGCHYYTGEAILSGGLSPDGCAIPTKEEWNALSTYVGGNAPALKSANWLVSDSVSVTSLSGLDLEPNGLFTFRKGYTGVTNPGKSVAYWIGGGADGTLAADSTVFYLDYRTDEVSTTLKGWSKDGNCFHGLSVRCIVKEEE